MKKLTVIVKPGDREDVIRIMESCAVYGVMETDITGYGNQKGYRVMYRGMLSGPNVLMKCKFETIRRRQNHRASAGISGKETLHRFHRRRKDFCGKGCRCDPYPHRTAR